MHFSMQAKVLACVKVVNGLKYTGERNYLVTSAYYGI